VKSWRRRFVYYVCLRILNFFLKKKLKEGENGKYRETSLYQDIYFKQKSHWFHALTFTQRVAERKAGENSTEKCFGKNVSNIKL